MKRNVFLSDKAVDIVLHAKGPAPSLENAVNNATVVEVTLPSRSQ